MEFYEKYVSAKESAYLALNPALDKDGKIIVDTRIVIADETFALCEALVELKNAILRVKNG